MAKFTYADFENEARKAGLLDKFSAADLKLAQENPDAGLSILNYKKDYLAATTDEMRALANAGAEKVRSSYGNYTGGRYGDQYYLNQLSPQDYDAPTVGSFTYDSAPSYESRYDAQLQEMLQGITNRDPFTYDAASDPLYAQYRKQYAREGQRATQDALGAAAAATGGMPSSYAVGAAAQAGNYYAAQMTDMIPELYDLAYNKYLNDFNMQLAQMEAVRGAEESDYMKFQDQLNQFNTDRNFDYGAYLDRVAQQNNERDFAYNQLIDEINNQAYREESDLAKAMNAASYGDFSLLPRVGITPDLAALTKDTTDDAYGYSEYDGDFGGITEEGGSAVDEEDEKEEPKLEDVYAHDIDEDGKLVIGKYHLTEEQVFASVAAGALSEQKQPNGKYKYIVVDKRKIVQ